METISSVSSFHCDSRMRLACSKAERAPETVSPKLAKIYHMMESADMLKSVNIEDKKRELMARGEGNPKGRPRRERE